MHIRFLCIAIAITVFSAGLARAEGLDVAGRWRTVQHGALVDIADCGDGSPCGVLAWVDPAIARGHVHDIRNPEPVLRGRALVGAPILWGFEAGGNGWAGGRLYNPETGQTFRSAVRLVSANRLRVTGCLGPFCRTQVWTRVAPMQAREGR